MRVRAEILSNVAGHTLWLICCWWRLHAACVIACARDGTSCVFRNSSLSACTANEASLSNKQRSRGVNCARRAAAAGKKSQTAKTAACLATLADRVANPKKWARSVRSYFAALAGDHSSHDQVPRPSATTSATTVPQPSTSSAAIML